jgi:hypothetical protein
MGRAFWNHCHLEGITAEDEFANINSILGIPITARMTNKTLSVAGCTVDYLYLN